MRGQAAEKAGARAGDFLSGKYLLEECLGIGGMGEVYRATNVSLGRKVAIKVLNKEHTSNEEDVMRFLREARAAAAVRHPNVVDVFDVSRDDDGTPFIVQELLAGEDLEQYILGRGTCLSAEESLEIMIPVADAVAAAHKQNVVHRDLKPANIFLAREGTNLIPKVLDFGAALYQTVGALSAKERKMLIGTPHYMAPEQITTATEVDQRADIWAMGVILYEMMVGETPFEAEDGNAVMKLVRTRSVQPLRKLVPLAPLSLEELVVRCLDRDRRKRFADASVLRAELEAVRTELKTHVRKRLDTVPELDLAPPGSARPLLPHKRLSTKRRGSSVLTLSSPDEDVSWDVSPPRSASRPIEVAKPVRTAADVIRDAELASPSRAARTAADVIRDAEAASSSRRSSIPPVLDPRSASGASSERGEKLPPSRPAFDSIDSTDSSPSIDLDLELTSADKARASQANREPARESTKDPSLTPALAPHRPPTPSTALRPQSEPERPFTQKENARLLASVALPALAAFVALSFAPSLTAPLGHAMRGDSPLASGVLAVLTLVGAAVLAARSLGSSRSMGLLVATVGAVVLGVVMIIVTFSASESVELGIPPAAGSIVPFIAPIVPLGLALAALKHARLYWFSRFEDERTEARRYAYVAGVLVLALLELSPFGAVRRAARTGVSAPATHQAP